jgi:hypothetical protein
MVDRPGAPAPPASLLPFRWRWPVAPLQTLLLGGIVVAALVVAVGVGALLRGPAPAVAPAAAVDGASVASSQGGRDAAVPAHRSSCRRRSIRP